MLRRLISYLKTLFAVRAEQAMDPEVEIEQAVREAQSRDRQLRNQAAKVVAHRTMLESQIERAATEVGKARELAKQALVRADEATKSGDAQAADRWTRTAQGLAMRLQAAENNLTSLREQHGIGVEQAESAKQAVQQNAMRLQELASRRMELVGRLEQARMQETVNRALESMTATLETEGPSLDRIETKIEQRLAESRAHAELRSATPEGAEAELREAVNLAEADRTLEELRAELGLTSGTGRPSSEITTGTPRERQLPA